LVAGEERGEPLSGGHCVVRRALGERLGGWEVALGFIGDVVRCGGDDCLGLDMGEFETLYIGTFLLR
jgi:hypothetical protein